MRASHLIILTSFPPSLFGANAKRLGLQHELCFSHLTYVWSSNNITPERLSPGGFFPVALLVDEGAKRSRRHELEI